MFWFLCRECSQRPESNRHGGIRGNRETLLEMSGDLSAHMLLCQIKKTKTKPKLWGETPDTRTTFQDQNMQSTSFFGHSGWSKGQNQLCGSVMPGKWGSFYLQEGAVKEVFFVWGLNVCDYRSIPNLDFFYWGWGVYLLPDCVLTSAWPNVFVSVQSPLEWSCLLTHPTHTHLHTHAHVHSHALAECVCYIISTHLRINIL